MLESLFYSPLIVGKSLLPNVRFVSHSISLDFPCPPKDLSLTAIVSPLRGYKLAWLINQASTLQLVNVQEFVQDEACVSYFLHDTEHATFRLIQNKLGTAAEEKTQYLIPTRSHFDFFFAVQDHTHTFDQNAFLRTIRAIDGVVYTAQLTETVWEDVAGLLEMVS